MEALPNTFVERIQQVSIRGSLDFYLCINGIFVALEAKTDTGKTSKIQDYKLDRIAKCGGVAMVITPSNWNVSYEYLRELAHKGSINLDDLYGED